MKAGHQLKPIRTELTARERLVDAYLLKDVRRVS